MSIICQPFAEKYKKDSVQKLIDLFSYENRMQVPSLEKIVINMGVGEATSNSKSVAEAFEDLRLISGQKPVIIKAKKSVAGFKLREGVDIGCKVTLRRKKMFAFLEKLVMIVLPRIRDFRGFSIKNFDGHGNLNMGIQEQSFFPEIDFNKITTLRGMNIVIVTSAKTNEEGKELLSSLMIPFKN